MPLRTRFVVLVAAAWMSGASGAPASVQPQQRPRPDFDVRSTLAPAAPLPRAAAALQRTPAGERRVRLDRDTGAVRVLDDTDVRVPRGSSPNALRGILASNANLLGLQPSDLASLVTARDYTSRSTGLRHVTFTQVVDGIPVFDSAITMHILADGAVVKVTSNAASTAGRSTSILVTSAAAIEVAAADVGRSRAGQSASLTWLPVAGRLVLAWHVVADVSVDELYDELIDAASGELLLRRNRVRFAEANGRVPQSLSMLRLDPRRPDAMPLGDGACPPPVNFLLRSLNAPYRDPATVVFDAGHLAGNNTHVYRGTAAVESAAGTFDGAQWTFDFPFNTPGSAETALFFALNFAHDFFYDLGFDEPAGNFQADNFGRGGAGGDSLKANARAAGRNNANFVPSAEGSSPTINMFLWDGSGCWAQDVDGDGTSDLDGDFDFDIIIHEFQHGVSLRLNTAFNGNEAGAIGEGGGDFFAYSLNGNPILAEYAAPGGIRSVNAKTYGDWYCLLGIICEVHDNGEIWANALWDVRERFRADLVRGTEAAAVNEAHQLYVDALKLSPPSPTMLDMRDAMLEADALRNAGTPTSANFCRLWEPFAARGMGVSATDTQDNGFNQVVAAFDVPTGCQPPPAPPTVTVTATQPNAAEAGPVNGVFTISRGVVQPTSLVVSYSMGGTATSGTDYVALQGTVTIPADAASVDVTLVPIDDTVLESKETAVLSLRTASTYVVGTPATAAVTIVSDDVAPDLMETALTVPRAAGSGSTIVVTDTVKNQGTGDSVASVTSFYLSSNMFLEATDPVVGSRAAGALAVGASDTGTSTLVLPGGLASGTYYLFAKADGPAAIVETQEGNNTRSATIQIGPDLIVSTMSAPASAGAGQSILVTDTTANTGGAPAPATTTRFFLSANYAYDASDTPLEARTVPALEPGASASAATSVTIPPGTVSGTYYLIAKADAGDGVAEWSETNNARYVLVRIGGDLYVYSLSVPARAAAGDPLAITDTTKNIGGGAAAASTTAFYLSANTTLDASDVRLQPDRAVPPLAAGATSTASTTVTIPAVDPGTWYVIASADDGRVVAEVLETNNVRYATLLVGPDLTVSAFVTPSTAAAGAAVTFTDTIKNSGPAGAAASVTRYYLSVNTLLDAGDLLLPESRGVPALAPGLTDTGSTTVVIPAGLSGTYYVFAVADGTNLVPEASESNNKSFARSLQIQ